MSRAERKTLDELLVDHPDGLEIAVDNFWDVNDASNPDAFDRVVVSTRDQETNVSYSGVCILRTPDGMTAADVQEFKLYLKTAWNCGDPIAFLRPQGEEGDANLLEPPTQGVPGDDDEEVAEDAPAEADVPEGENTEEEPASEEAVEEVAEEVEA